MSLITTETTTLASYDRKGERVPRSTPVDDLHELVEVHLRRMDQRYTAGRQAVVELLASLGHPASIADIADHIPDVPRSSAYRHLSDLQRAGVVRRIASGDEFARFELAEDLTHHHHRRDAEHRLRVDGHANGRRTDGAAGFRSDVARPRRDRPLRELPTMRRA
jgi:DNA-binding transcriptional ArsR family regulator